MQINLEPEHRARIAGIQCGFVVGLETTGEDRRADIANGQGATGVLKDLHHLAQGQPRGGLVELDCAGQHRQPGQQ